MTRPNDPSAFGYNTRATLEAHGSHDGHQRVTPEYANNNHMTDQLGNNPTSFESAYHTGVNEGLRQAQRQGSVLAGTSSTGGTNYPYQGGGGGVERNDTTFQHIPSQSVRSGSYDHAVTGFNDNPTYTSADGVTSSRLYDSTVDMLDPDTGKPTNNAMTYLGATAGAVAGAAAYDKATVNRLRDMSHLDRAALHNVAKERGYVSPDNLLYKDGKIPQVIENAAERNPGGAIHRGVAEREAELAARREAGKGGRLVKGVDAIASRAGKKEAELAAREGAEQLAKKGLLKRGATQLAIKGGSRLGARAAVIAAGSAIPGPGWAVSAGLAAWTIIDLAMLNPKFRAWAGGLWRKGGIAVDTPPNPPETHWLPDTKDRDGRRTFIHTADDVITDLNNSVTGIEPDKFRMWDVTGGNALPGLPRMTNVQEHVNGMANQLNTLNENMNRLLNGRSSTMLGDYAASLKQPLTDVGNFTSDAGKPLTDAVVAATGVANETYQLILDANQKSREALAHSKGNRFFGLKKSSSIGDNDLVTNADPIRAKLEEMRQRQADIARSMTEWADRFQPAALRSNPQVGAMSPEELRRIQQDKDNVMGRDGVKKESSGQGNVWRTPNAPGNTGAGWPGGGRASGGSPFGGGGFGSVGGRGSSGGGSGSIFGGGTGSSGIGGSDSGSGKKSNLFDTESSNPFDDDRGSRSDGSSIFGNGKDGDTLFPDSGFDEGTETDGETGNNPPGGEGNAFDTHGSDGSSLSGETGSNPFGGGTPSSTIGDGSSLSGGTGSNPFDGSTPTSTSGDGFLSGNGSSGTNPFGSSDYGSSGLPGAGSDTGGLGISGGSGDGVFGSGGGSDLDDYNDIGFDGNGPIGDGGDSRPGGLGDYGSNQYDADGNLISRGDSTGITSGGDSAFDPGENANHQLDDIFGGGDGNDSGSTSEFDPESEGTGGETGDGGDPFDPNNDNYDPFGGEGNGSGAAEPALDENGQPITDENGNPLDTHGNVISDGESSGSTGGGSTGGGGGGFGGGGFSDTPGADAPDMGGDASGDSHNVFADGAGDMPGADGDTPAEGVGGTDNTVAASVGGGDVSPDGETSVDVDGSSRQFLNPETAELARKILDPSFDGSSMPFKDLAESVGITMPDGVDSGVPIGPAEAQPGDVMTAGGKDWLFVGDGQVLDPTTGEIGNVSDIAANGFGGEGDGFFRLDADEGKLLDDVVGGSVDGSTGDTGFVSGDDGGSGADVTDSGETITENGTGGTSPTADTTDTTPPSTSETGSTPADTGFDATAAQEPSVDTTTQPEGEETAPFDPSTTPGGSSTGDGMDYQRTEEAPIGMGNGQNVPDGTAEPVASGGASAGGVEAGNGGSYAAGSQAATDTTATSGGPSEVPFEGAALGGTSTHTSGQADTPAPGDSLNPDDII